MKPICQIIGHHYEVLQTSSVWAWIFCRRCGHSRLTTKPKETP